MGARSRGGMISGEGGTKLTLGGQASLPRGESGWQHEGGGVWKQDQHAICIAHCEIEAERLNNGGAGKPASRQAASRQAGKQAYLSQAELQDKEGAGKQVPLRRCKTIRPKGNEGKCAKVMSCKRAGSYGTKHTAYCCCICRVLSRLRPRKQNAAPFAPFTSRCLHLPNSAPSDATPPPPPSSHPPLPCAACSPCKQSASPSP